MGLIVSVKRFEIHDGDGVRTTVFLKGCPLQCRWCHNPECINAEVQMAFLREKCMNCGRCTEACGAQQMRGGVHLYRQSDCTACGRCSKVCPTGAMRRYGESVTPQQLLPRLTEDRPFFDRSGGGVTISGGEPLMQPEFTLELLRLLRQAGVHTALDTCGFAAGAVVEAAAAYTDVFLYDIKAIDEQVHLRATGQPNGIILENLLLLNRLEKQVEVRIPLVPQYNGGQIEKIGAFLRPLSCITRVRVLPYHSFGNAKYAPLGRAAEELLPPSAAEVRRAVDTLRGFGLDAASDGL